MVYMAGPWLLDLKLAKKKPLNPNAFKRQIQRYNGRGERI